MHAPLREIVKAPPAFGPALALEYRRLLVPVIAGQPSDAAMDVACRLAAERGSRIVALNVLEVPLDRPLTDDLPELERTANRELDEAIAIGDSYGVRVLGRLERARSAGQAIVAEAEARNAEIIVLGSPRADAGDDSSLRCSGRPSTSSSSTRRAGSWSRPGTTYEDVPRSGRGLRARSSSGSESRLLVRTAAEGGGVVGFVLGGLFIALGVGRLMIERKRHGA